MSQFVLGLQRVGRRLRSPRVIALGLLALAIYTAYRHPPVETIGAQEVGLRLNRWTGSTTILPEGAALVIPGVHELRHFRLDDHLYRPQRSSTAAGEAPLQSSEGLSLGVELAIRYAVDPQRLDTLGRKLPTNIDGELVDPLLQGVIYRAFTRYTVREIFSSKRQELQDTIETELKPLMAKEGLILKSVMNRENGVHVATHRQAGQGNRAARRGGKSASRESGGSLGERTDHRGEGSGRGHETCHSVQAETDRATQA